MVQIPAVCTSEPTRTGVLRENSEGPRDSIFGGRAAGVTDHREIQQGRAPPTSPLESKNEGREGLPHPPGLSAGVADD